MDAPADSDEHHVRSLEAAGVFRTQEDALLPGWHEWESNYQVATGGSLADWRAIGLSWETTCHAVVGDAPGLPVISLVL